MHLFGSMIYVLPKNRNLAFYLDLIRGKKFKEMILLENNTWLPKNGYRTDSNGEPCHADFLKL